MVVISFHIVFTFSMDTLTEDQEPELSKEKKSYNLCIDQLFFFSVQRACVRGGAEESYNLN